MNKKRLAIVWTIALNNLVDSAKMAVVACFVKIFFHDFNIAMFMFGSFSFCILKIADLMFTFTDEMIDDVYEYSQEELK